MLRALIAFAAGLITGTVVGSNGSTASEGEAVEEEKPKPVEVDRTERFVELSKDIGKAGPALVSAGVLLAAWYGYKEIQVPGTLSDWAIVAAVGLPVLAGFFGYVARGIAESRIAADPEKAAMTRGQDYPLMYGALGLQLLAVVLTVVVNVFALYATLNAGPADERGLRQRLELFVDGEVDSAVVLGYCANKLNADGASDGFLEACVALSAAATGDPPAIDVAAAEGGLEVLDD